MYKRHQLRAVRISVLLALLLFVSACVAPAAPQTASEENSAAAQTEGVTTGDNLPIIKLAEYIDKQGLVENGGLLGPVGKIGWYIPTYLLQEHPELATWEGLQDPENAAMFSTAETGDQGQFLTGDPSWTQYEDDIIDNLGLNFQIVAAGSEEAILAALDAAYSREDPLLFYFWTPHSVHAKYDLTDVELPPYSEECYAQGEAGGIDCDYPPDALFKIFWGGLAEAAPTAYNLLRNMNYSTQDQIQMIANVELDGMPVEEAARAWMDANQETWQAWLDN